MVCHSAIYVKGEGHVPGLLITNKVVEIIVVFSLMKIDYSPSDNYFEAIVTTDHILLPKFNGWLIL